MLPSLGDPAIILGGLGGILSGGVFTATMPAAVAAVLCHMSLYIEC